MPKFVQDSEDKGIAAKKAQIVGYLNEDSINIVGLYDYLYENIVEKKITTSLVPFESSKLTAYKKAVCSLLYDSIKGWDKQSLLDLRNFIRQALRVLPLDQFVDLDFVDLDKDAHQEMAEKLIAHINSKIPEEEERITRDELEREGALPVPMSDQSETKSSISVGPAETIKELLIFDNTTNCFVLPSLNKTEGLDKKLLAWMLENPENLAYAKTLTSKSFKPAYNLLGRKKDRFGSFEKIVQEAERPKEHKTKGNVGGPHQTTPGDTDNLNQSSNELQIVNAETVKKYFASPDALSDALKLGDNEKGEPPISTIAKAEEMMRIWANDLASKEGWLPQQLAKKLIGQEEKGANTVKFIDHFKSKSKPKPKPGDILQNCLHMIVTKELFAGNPNVRAFLKELRALAEKKIYSALLENIDALYRKVDPGMVLRDQDLVGERAQNRQQNVAKAMNQLRSFFKKSNAKKWCFGTPAESNNCSEGGKSLDSPTAQFNEVWNLLRGSKNGEGETSILEADILRAAKSADSLASFCTEHILNSVGLEENQLAPEEALSLIDAIFREMPEDNREKALDVFATGKLFECFDLYISQNPNSTKTVEYKKLAAELLFSQAFYERLEVADQRNGNTHLTDKFFEFTENILGLDLKNPLIVDNDKYKFEEEKGLLHTQRKGVVNVPSSSFDFTNKKFLVPDSAIARELSKTQKLYRRSDENDRTSMVRIAKENAKNFIALGLMAMSSNANNVGNKHKYTDAFAFLRDKKALVDHQKELSEKDSEYDRELARLEFNYDYGYWGNRRRISWKAWWAGKDKKETASIFWSGFLSMFVRSNGSSSQAGSQVVATPTTGNNVAVRSTKEKSPDSRGAGSSVRIMSSLGGVSSQPHGSSDSSKFNSQDVDQLVTYFKNNKKGTIDDFAAKNGKEFPVVFSRNDTELSTIMWDVFFWLASETDQQPLTAFVKDLCHKLCDFKENYSWWGSVSYQRSESAKENLNVFWGARPDHFSIGNVAKFVKLLSDADLALLFWVDTANGSGVLLGACQSARLGEKEMTKVLSELIKLKSKYNNNRTYERVTGAIYQIFPSLKQEQVFKSEKTTCINASPR